MRLAILALVSGIWLCQQQPQLPAWPALIWCGAAALGLGLLAACLHRRTSRRMLSLLVLAPAAGLAGFVWAAGLAQWRLADTLPEENEGRDIQITGVIAALPQAYDHGVRFEFDVEHAQAEVPARLWLAWYRGWREEEWHRPQPVHAGERWQMTVRLKRPHGNLNPHGFDYEAFLFERGLRATGYIRPSPQNRRLDAFVLRPNYWIERLREDIRERFARVLEDRAYAGVLVALVIGDQRAIDSELWQVYNRTGTTHLMSISGLHVTMVAGLAYWLVSWGWRRVPGLVLRLPAQKAAAVGGWGAAFAYCLLAGFGVPAQRTLYMLTVVALALWRNRAHSASRVLALALLIVVVLDPWAVLAAGFWLSFAAVAVLFYAGAGRIGSPHWLRSWLSSQWAVTIGLIPLLLALFHQFSLVSPLANAVAIPAISLVVTPLALIATAVPFDPLLGLCHWLLGLLMLLLQSLAALPAAVWQQAVPQPWAVAAALAGCAVMLLPSGFPARWAGAAMVLPLVLIAPPRPPPGTVVATALDVGQGLAVHIQTADHDLLYDTGPQFSPEANSGNRIILPYLRARGVSRLDGLVVSHADTDHEGGAASIVEGLPVGWLASSLPSSHPLRALGADHRPCFAGQRWNWDGVEFEFLHPAWEAYAAPPPKSNDSSCVLAVRSAGGSVLLTGDIEAESESLLLARAHAHVAADMLLAPHHGSRSSSTDAFIAAVGARTVVFSAAYRNRFRHPQAEVERRYAATGARLLRTDRDGAVIVTLSADGHTVVRERAARQRYWHGQ